MYKTKNKHHSDYDLYDDLAKIKSALVDAGQDVKGRANEIWTQSIDDMKEKSEVLQDNVASYVAEKPFKSLGIALASGFVLGFLYRK